MVTKILTKKEISTIREKVASGNPKNSVAKELGFPPSTVNYHTRGLSPKKEPVIKGKTLNLLRQLLTNGYVFGRENGENRGYHLRKLQHLLPMIRTAFIDHRTIYYLEDKKHEALYAVVKHRNSRIINYYDLMTVSKVFNVDLKDAERKYLLRKKSKTPCQIIRQKEGGFSSSLLLSQQKLCVEFNY